MDNTKLAYALWQANKDVSRCLYLLSEEMPGYRRTAYLIELEELMTKQKAMAFAGRK